MICNVVNNLNLLSAGIGRPSSLKLVPTRERKKPSWRDSRRNMGGAAIRQSLHVKDTRLTAD
jgi:hypothetical protein